MDRIITAFLVVVIVIVLIALHAQMFLAGLGLVIGVTMVLGGCFFGFVWGMDECFFLASLKFLSIIVLVIIPACMLSVFCFQRLF